MERKDVNVKIDDTVDIAIYDCASGMAKVLDVNESGLRIQWLEEPSMCYSCAKQMTEGTVWDCRYEDIYEIKKEEKLEINKMLSLSTIHVTERTAHLLENYPEKLQVVVYDKPSYGWFVHVPDDLLLEVNVDDDTCPQDLYDCLRLAYNKDCGWIMFDSDVEPIAGLKQYA